MKLILTIVAALTISTAFTQGAAAKMAKCFSSDDGGNYACNFEALDKNGSFRISAPGKPTFTVEIDQPGVAFVFADFGTGRNVALPGPYVRSVEDPACWVNKETKTDLCAW